MISGNWRVGQVKKLVGKFSNHKQWLSIVFYYCCYKFVFVSFPPFLDKSSCFCCYSCCNSTTASSSSCWCLSLLFLFSRVVQGGVVARRSNAPLVHLKTCGVVLVFTASRFSVRFRLFPWKHFCFSGVPETRRVWSVSFVFVSIQFLSECVVDTSIL